MSQPISRSSPVPTLPQPRPPIDPAAEPFVGNESVDDNLIEATGLALWKVLGDEHHAISIAVQNGAVTLSGSLASKARHRLAEQTARRVPGVREVINDVVVAGRKAGPAVRRSADSRTVVEDVPLRPMVYLVRYCSVDEASLSAALRQGQEILDAFLVARGLPAATELIAVYRNRQHETVTMEIGVPVDATVAQAIEGELRAGQVPNGSFMVRGVAAGLPRLLEGEAALLGLGRTAALSTEPYFWQSFSAAQFRPWQGHPAAKVYMPVQRSSQ